MQINWRKNIFSKKGVGYAMTIPRIGMNWVASHDDYTEFPPIIANSFPKSGTHLLIQILQTLPGVRNWGLFLASIPSFTFQEIKPKRMSKKVLWLAPGEMAGAHLFYSAEVSAAIKEKNVIHFFIYRDPRDVVISESYYLTLMNRWHRLSKYFRALSNMEERVMFSITGATDPDFPYDYPDVAQRFRKYQPWIYDSNVFSIKYEDLITKKKDQVVREIVQFYSDRSCLKFSIDTCIAKALKNINPKNSHTFRQGKIGGWCSVFSEKHKHYFKDISGDLLIALGYEQDKNW